MATNSPSVSIDTGKTHLEKIYFLANSNGKQKLSTLYVNIPRSKASKLKTKINALFKECNICKRKVSLCKMANHTNHCLINLQKTYKCFYCSAKFSNIKTIKTHLKKYHAKLGVLKNKDLTIKNNNN